MVPCRQRAAVPQRRGVGGSFLLLVSLNAAVTLGQPFPATHCEDVACPTSPCFVVAWSGDVLRFVCIAAFASGVQALWG